MKDYITRKILNKTKLNEIREIINNLEWKDGLQTTNGIEKDIKNNLESSDARVNKIIMESIDGDKLFHSFVLPKTSNTSILSKMVIGGYYHVHHDSFENGDYSTTVFLNEPDEYEGGELCLLVEDEEVLIKLNAGEAVTYPTGLLHKVNEVTSGERIVSVFWTKTIFKDKFMREVYCDLNKILNLLKYNEKIKTLEEANNDPCFMIKALLYKINRQFG